MSGSTGPINVGDDGGMNKLVVGGLAIVAAGLLAFMMFGSSFTGGDDKPGPDTAAASGASGASGEAADANVIYNRAVFSTNVDGAKVYLDGVEKCTAPCGPKVPVGDGQMHEIKLQKDGYIPVTVNWGPASVTEDPPPMPDMQPLR